MSEQRKSARDRVRRPRNNQPNKQEDQVKQTLDILQEERENLNTERSDFEQERNQARLDLEQLRTTANDDAKKIKIEAFASTISEIQQQRENFHNQTRKMYNDFLKKIDKKLKNEFGEVTANISVDAESYKNVILEGITEYNVGLTSLLNDFSDQISSKVRNFDEVRKSIINVYELQLTSSQKEYDENVKQLEKMITTNQESLITLKNEMRKKEEELTNLKRELSEIDSIRLNLEFREKELTRIEKQNDKFIEERLQSETLQLKTRYDRLNKQFQELVENYEKLREENQFLNSSIERREKIEEYVKRENALLNQVAALQNEIKNSKFNVDLKTYNSLKKENDQNRQKVLDLEQYKGRFDLLQATLDNKLEVIKVLEADRKERNIALEGLRERLEELETELGLRTSIEGKTTSIYNPIIKENSYTIVEDDISELKWLENMASKIEDYGFVFPKRLIYSFHTSLLSNAMSPLVVLSGVSGTGKSKLPELYAKIGGLFFLLVSVQPDWDSPSSVFGYHNPINNKYNATSILQFMVQMQGDNGLNDLSENNVVDLSQHMGIVLLDEMNLAYVELYFSDMLSKFEKKRNSLEKEYVELDLHGGEFFKIELTDNLMWVGTMNEDESTKTLSDKVIDRGNILRFPKPESFVKYKANNQIESSGKILKSLWSTWKNKVSTPKISSDLVDEYRGVVEEINNHLQKSNRTLGHRVWQAIELYIYSHPMQNRITKQNERQIGNKIFEEAIVYKVIPKMRGIETSNSSSSRKETINPVLDTLKTYVTEGFKVDFDKAVKGHNDMFTWVSSTYLDEQYE